jgi:hypothetical protein
MPADLVQVVAQALGEAPTSREQQQPGRLDRVPCHRDHRGPLEAFGPVPDVVHAGRPAGPLVEADAGHH